MKKLILIAAVWLASLSFPHADVFIKQKTSTGAFMGQPAKEIFQECWLGANKMAMISPENITILNLDAKKFFMVNNRNKTYVEADLPLDMTKLMPEQMASMMKGMMEGMTIGIQANGQNKKVMTWNTDGFDAKMTMMGMEMKMIFWASKEVPFDWKKYMELYWELTKAQFRVGEKFMEEFKKVQGYPLETEVETMGMKVNTTTVEIDPTKQPDPGVYSVPAGYTKKDKLAMEDMQK